MLFLGSFLVAAALERHDLHARVASGLLRRFDRRGDAPRRLLLGVIVATASLSMWASNTAAAAMMAPLAATAAAGGDESLRDAVAVAVALSSSLGGLTTLVGTGPNVVLAGLVGDRVAFASWFAFAAPVGLVGNACLWAILVRRFKVPVRVAGRLRRQGRRRSRRAAARARRLRRHDLCWLFRLRRFGVPGWSELLPEPGFATDGTVAMAAALALFLSDALPWAAVRDLPWESMFLLGGGVA
ncbi:succinate transmembrane transporter [Aureococcus anophagefferens]|nr:succinate transmembrane transporter [Aureococcus anophagefferens]